MELDEPIIPAVLGIVVGLFLGIVSTIIIMPSPDRNIQANCTNMMVCPTPSCNETHNYTLNSSCPAPIVNVKLENCNYTINITNNATKQYYVEINGGFALNANS